MEKGHRNKIFTEIVWLFTLLLISAAAEYAIITLFDLHPVLSVKIQGLIGLLIVGYGIRMAARLWSLNRETESEENGHPRIKTESDSK